MGRIGIGRVFTVQDPKMETALQEIATEAGNNLQYGTSAPDADSPGKVYFQYSTSDETTGWAEVTTIFINVKR